MRYDLVVLENDQIRAAALTEADPVSSLRVYRVSSQEDVSRYRQQAARNRRVHNTFQGVIIVGSIVVTSLTSAGLEAEWSRWTAAVVAGLVSVAAGFTGYFKFRERSFNQQQTADAIEKEFKAVELTIDPYGNGELEDLRTFARKVKDLKEEQRKRELQLEQSSNPPDSARQ
ncbi:DUF4231 domain-containing protein [Pseudonocardia lutea]|uniref:DUF4231 domain-containing protein n=1 Tax=Pseudonocardia lutea TaxID=2172015 RepID=A0ABW1IHH7_9PSEU